MILKTEDLKLACSKISKAVKGENYNTANLMGMLELKTVDGVLYLNVTNREYFIEVKLGICNEDFHATVNADLFTSLISEVTTEDIEISVTDAILNVKANGNYKFALIYDNDKILELPKIEILNKTVNFNIDSTILKSILDNNKNELSKIPNNPRIPIRKTQKMYYIDNEGAITYYNGACINKFTLEQPVKMLLNQKLVEFFSLFKDDVVGFTLGYDAISEDIIQTKVEFKSENICLTAILDCDDNLIKSMPAAAIRAKAFNDYPYVVSLNREQLRSAIKRLKLFAENGSAISGYKTSGKFVFTKDGCTISDYTKENSEVVKYAAPYSSDLNYEAVFDLTDIELALNNSTDSLVSINFGDHSAIVLAKDNIYTVIPEMTLV